MLESHGRQREVESRRRGHGKDRIKQSGRRGGREICRSIRMHQRVETEERDTPPETAVSVRAMVTL